MTTKESIVHMALDLFNEHGVYRVGVREIARKLDISPGNLSYHFKKKEDLLSYILTEYSNTNTRIRSHYKSLPPHFGRFMHMFYDIFKNQYAHRGILSEIIEVNRLLREINRTDLRSAQSERTYEFSEMIHKLQDTGSMKTDEGLEQDMLGLITIYGRFWIAEAFLHSNQNDLSVTISYANKLANIFRLFATEQGLSEIEAFRNELN